VPLSRALVVWKSSFVDGDKHRMTLDDGRANADWFAPASQNDLLRLDLDYDSGSRRHLTGPHGPPAPAQL
jgi:hypothetical protein